MLPDWFPAPAGTCRNPEWVILNMEGEGKSRAIDQAIKEIQRFLEQNEHQSDTYPEVRRMLLDLLEQQASTVSAEVPGSKEIRDGKNDEEVRVNPQLVTKNAGRDIKELKKAQETLLNQIRREELISTIARQFISAPSGQIFDDIRLILGRIGEFIGADRCHIILLSADGTTIEEMFEWCSERAEPIEPYVTGTSVEGYRWLMPRLADGETVTVEKIGSLSPEAQAEQTFWKNLGAKSVLYIPLSLNNELIGMFAVMHRRTKKWAETDQKLLETAGNLFVNVLARKQNEDALIESEQKYRTIFDNHLNPIIIAGDDGRLTDANVAALDFIERRMEDMRERPVAEWMPGFELIRPSMQPHQARRRTIETEYTVHGKTKSMLLQVVPLTIGNETLLYGIGQDITERKRAERNLRETTDFLNNLLTYANAPIIVWDPRLGITRFNHAFERITGRTEAEVRGIPLDILFPAYATVESLELIHAAAAGERLEAVEIPILHIDGTVRTVLWNSANIYSPDGYLIATIAQGQDITEMKRLGRELKMSEERFRHIASFTQENPQPILEIRNDGSVAFANIACGLALRRLGLPNNPDLFFPADIAGILTEVQKGNDGFFYREIMIGDAIFGEAIYLSPEHKTIRIYAQDLTRERRQ